MDEDIKILKWYQNQGLDEALSNDKRKPTNDLEEKINISSMFKSGKSDSSRVIADRCNDLESLRESVKNFDGCLLKKTATNTVFSDGNPSAKVMLIGEAPGANEDIQGIPFCGESGKLLDQIFSSIDLNRKENLYITNSVFWRPPGNRKPTEEEIKICLPFLEKHISIVKPQLVIAVGAISLYALLNYTGSISKKRQQIFHYTNPYLASPIKAMTIFHPAYLLRQPSQKKSAWQDMLLIKKILEEGQA
ncbi:MAG: uracil-DNA glycosylase [Alphaproteobacteria bacterium]|nr:uracil-DNA glycosylase [Alphaproteobacteria bacterium]